MIALSPHLSIGLQEAFLDPNAWAGWLSQYANDTGAVGAGILLLSDRSTDAPASPSLGELFDRYRHSDWHRLDFRAAGIPKLLGQGLLVDQDIADERTITTHPFYNDLLGRYGLRWFAGLAFETGDQTWCLTTQRSIRQGPFEPHEQATLMVFRQSLIAAAGLAVRLDRARLAGVADGLEAVGCPALLLDGRGRLVTSNRSAEPYLRGDLTIRAGRIVARLATPDPVIPHVEAVLAGRAAAPAVVPRVDRPALVVTGRLLQGTARSILDSAHVLLTIVDPDRAARRDLGSLLQTLHGLTPAEGRVAAAVGAGRNVERVAAELRLTRETVRTTLKAVFAKCGVSRQAELVRLATVLDRASAPGGGAA